MPYVVPLNYGYLYENGLLSLFFHSALQGKKIDIINKNKNCCFEMDCDGRLIEGEKACNYSYSYKSVIGFGEVIVLTTIEEKIYGLNRLMQHHTKTNIKHEFGIDELKKVIVYKMVVKNFTGKQKLFIAK